MIGILPVLLVLVFFIALTWWQRRYRVAVAEIPASDALKNTLNETLVPLVLMQDDLWWQKLDNLQKTKLACHLAETAIPVWEKYAGTEPISYGAVALTIVETHLLPETLNEINNYSHDIQRINHRYKIFLSHVIDLKDGIWVCPHPVKKIVLSVYYILLSIVGQQSSAAQDRFLVESINAALECLELSHLYSREEIHRMIHE